MIERDERPFLEQLDDAERAVLDDRGTRRRFRRGSVLFHEGDSTGDVFVLLEGQAKVVVTAKDGRQVLLVIRSEGDIVGELAAIDDTPRSATVIALDDVHALVIPADRFRELIDEQPRIVRYLLTAMAARMRQTSMRQLEFGLDDALSRVCRRLVEMGERYGEARDDGILVDAPLSQQDMASWSGLSRQAVVKALTALRSLGWIETSGGQFTICDIEAVRARATLVGDV